jgi:hypothetical protein
MWAAVSTVRRMTPIYDPRGRVRAWLRDDKIYDLRGRCVGQSERQLGARCLPLLEELRRHRKRPRTFTEADLESGQEPRR